MGTPEFAVPSLDILVQKGYNVVAVITSTDKYGGRGGKKLLESPVKKYAVEHNIPVLQPKNLKSPEFIEELRTFNADLQMVVAFRMLPEVVWNMPSLGTYNLHGSLLPKYRGAAPINWAIINGDKVTGVTTFKLKHEIDTGDLILQKEVDILETDDAGNVHDKMMVIGAKAVLETIQLIKSGKVKMKPQDAALVSKAPKIFHKDCEINFEQYGVDIINFIRGLSPYPAAWMAIDEREMKVFKAQWKPVTHNIPCGKVYTDNKNHLSIFCSDGIISVEDIKMQGKKRMDIKSYLNGNTILLK
ncbi:MAG: methionyl-tRNA formyltransferase [Saprospiraceae bacterium]|nr:methionyl-tRNA formyltransferase [Saprospiraceae bacterium]